MKQYSHRNFSIIIAISIIIIALIVAAGLFLYYHPQSNINPHDATSSELGFDYAWADNHPYIAHAFGGILGDGCTNSYEAFLLNYQLGHRVFEVDFSITDDGKTVAVHDDELWREKATFQTSSDTPSRPSTPIPFTYDNFMSSLWLNKYHPLDLAGVFYILQQYPDVYIVTDTKFSDETLVRQQFTDFVTTAQAINPALLDRFIIQIYHPEMLDWIMDIYPWKSVIYTLYSVWDTWTPENVLEFTQKTDVKFITIRDSWLTDEAAALWKANGIIIATHTVNDLTNAATARARGVSVIYTDSLYPHN